MRPSSMKPEAPTAKSESTSSPSTSTERDSGSNLHLQLFVLISYLIELNVGTSKIPDKLIGSTFLKQTDKAELVIKLLRLVEIDSFIYVWF